jgi:hypothetical protein
MENLRPVRSYHGLNARPVAARPTIVVFSFSSMSPSSDSDAENTKVVAEARWEVGGERRGVGAAMPSGGLTPHRG